MRDSEESGAESYPGSLLIEDAERKLLECRDNRPKLAYHYNGRDDQIVENLGDVEYGVHHPMKPFRLKLTHNLIVGYGLLKHLHFYVRT